MQPMNHNSARMFIWTLQRESLPRPRGEGKAEYVRGEDPVRVYFSLAEKSGTQTEGGYVDAIEIPAWVNGNAEISVGDCIGDSTTRKYRVVASTRIRVPYAQTQLRLKEL